MLQDRLDTLGLFHNFDINGIVFKNISFVIIKKRSAKTFTIGVLILLQARDTAVFFKKTQVSFEIDEEWIKSLLQNCSILQEVLIMRYRGVDYLHTKSFTVCIRTQTVGDKIRIKNDLLFEDFVIS